MLIRKSVWITFGLVFMSLGLAGLAQHLRVAAAGPCPSGPTHFNGLQEDCGYFSRERTAKLVGSVIPGGVLRDDRYTGNFNVTDFIAQLRGAGRNGDFVMRTMLGNPGDYPDPWVELRRRVQQYHNSGKIDIGYNNGDANCSWSTYPGNPGSATFTGTDIAWGNKSGGWAICSTKVIKFGNEYVLDRECGNPRDREGPLKKRVAWDAKVETVGVEPTAVVEPNGAPVTVRFRIHNDGPDETGADGQHDLECLESRTQQAGYRSANGSPPDSGNPTGCGVSHLGNGGNHEVSFTVVPGAAENTTICQSFVIRYAKYDTDPPGPNPAGGYSAKEQCVYVMTKPYFKVFNGDVSVGGDIESASGSCVAFNTAAGVTAWNKDATGTYGAGAQYAVYAFAAINEFASAQNIAGAAAPKGLTFANAGPEVFGGLFGTSTCIPDYYARKPATITNALPINGPHGVNVNALHTGSYFSDGSVTIAGTPSGNQNINPGQRTIIYVHGDAYIAGNIGTSSSAWSFDQIPLFQVVADGNIYISNGVTNLYGIYVAKNTIYTCATSAAPLTANQAIYSQCGNKLTVNGSFIARNVDLLRRPGSLYQSYPTETSASNNAAEVFNYSPAFWFVQAPEDTESRIDSYDAITSLPPIL